MATSKTATYTLTKAGERYNPRPNTQHDNAKSWSVLKELFTKGKGKVTMKQMQDSVSKVPEKCKSNHPGFIKYAMRRGWIEPAAA